MDLRMAKTKKQIKAAFLTLREKLMPDKIKVKDICEMAMINKSTFYHHYTDSIELSNEIDDSTIDKVLSSFPAREKIFEDPRTYIVELLRALESQSAELKAVFRGKQDILCAKLERKMHELYDDTAKTTEDGIRISFIIGGISQVVKEYLFIPGKCDNIDDLADALSHLFETLFHKKNADTKA